MYGSMSDSQHSQWERKSGARISQDLWLEARDTGLAMLYNKLVIKPFRYCCQGIFHGKWEVATSELRQAGCDESHSLPSLSKALKQRFLCQDRDSFIPSKFSSLFFPWVVMHPRNMSNRSQQESMLSWFLLAVHDLMMTMETQRAGIPAAIPPLYQMKRGRRHEPQTDSFTLLQQWCY